MAVRLYLEGHLLHGERIQMPVSSCTLVLMAAYAHPSSFHLVFVHVNGHERLPVDDNIDDDVQSDGYMVIQASGLSSMTYEFIHSSHLPDLVKNVQLPCVLDTPARMVRSGLCVIVRHIIKTAHSAVPDQQLIDLLGFRQGSLRMCAEVSGWTKLCEVELPESIEVTACELRKLYNSKPKHNTVFSTVLSPHLVKLEAHFEKPPKVHNDDRRRRQELANLHRNIADPEGCAKLLECARIQDGSVVLEKLMEASHGWKKIRVVKKLLKTVTDGGGGDGDGSHMTSTEITENELEEDRIFQTVKSATYQDVQLVHLYSEGIEMTIADLCLFTYLYFLLESFKFNPSALTKHIPRVIGWMRHMVTLPRLQNAALGCGLDFEKLRRGLLHSNGDLLPLELLHPEVPLGEQMDEDDLELSRRCHSKHKAIKPEVVEAMNKMKLEGIEPKIGSHPRGDKVTLDWNSLPSYVHPKDGDVPQKRVERKCQQLENLITAVTLIARPGDVIVDFCSGGGHLGIAIAHLLPQCTVFLVENKEESLAKAQKRMAEMKEDNVVLYQCNLDYFTGGFNVGVSLHACGSATDMVLHKCIRQGAAFVICPCCYGGIQRTHLLTYPQSKLYKDKKITYKEFLTLGHAADQTEFNIALEEQGRQCMNLVDNDRVQLAREDSYQVTLTSLQPLTCSPKNNLLIGQTQGFTDLSGLLEPLTAN